MRLIAAALALLTLTAVGVEAQKPDAKTWAAPQPTSKTWAGVQN